MKAQISTIIKTNQTTLWAELQQISSLIYVASPILKIKSHNDHALPEKWEIGIEYKLKLYFFGIIPLGKHFIKLVKIDADHKTIISNEHGDFIKAWNHTIQITPLSEQSVKYTDEIDIQAGLLTLPTWIFAHIFYRHRQKKWKQFLRGNNRLNTT